MPYQCNVVTSTLISNSVTDYIQKRRGESGLFSFEYTVAKFDIKVKVTTWIGHQGEQNVLHHKV